MVSSDSRKRSFTRGPSPVLHCQKSSRKGTWLKMGRQQAQASTLSNFFWSMWNRTNRQNQGPCKSSKPIFSCRCLSRHMHLASPAFALPGRHSSSGPLEHFNSHYPALTSSKDHTSCSLTALFRVEGEAKSQGEKKISPESLLIKEAN